MEYGAIWTNKFKEDYFPDADQILDWYHAVEHLWDTARVFFGENDMKRCEEWESLLKAFLWEGKVDVAIARIYQEAMLLKSKRTTFLNYEVIL
ncbi:MAG: hypothetical protein SVZ03_09890 [Spirochaetota bacterium]|nr:hypothetical protein [Spirochaetota bacterium]